ncbi:Nicotinate-nucleotide--dimethylbenzimidazole phosphoribosyltransferase [Actinobacteria bacterium OK074]|nr:Nicotinate-nucleotide--dimethylbenzimidazole phosphoribosyltransferase [Actinobacteria bacterium OK074]
MTDTGQVPGEGLPESAGTVEQPGGAAPAAYAYLDPSDTDEDLLLLPGQQGAWGNEGAPPAPAPAPTTVLHEPGPHETGGRDTGSVDLGAVRMQTPAPAPQQAPVRRPLHLGPPTPNASASPVRSLADRGPADAPTRYAVPTAGPEYLDATQLGDVPPQGGMPWGAAAQVGVVGVAAETVVPAEVVPTEAVVPEGVVPEGVGPEAGLVQAPEITFAAPEPVPGAEAVYEFDGSLDPQEVPVAPAAVEVAEAEAEVLPPVAADVSVNADVDVDVVVPAVPVVPVAEPEAVAPEVAESGQLPAPEPQFAPVEAAPVVQAQPEVPEALAEPEPVAPAPEAVQPQVPEAVEPETVEPETVEPEAVVEEAVIEVAPEPPAVQPVVEEPAPEPAPEALEVPEAPEALEPQPVVIDEAPAPVVIDDDVDEAVAEVAEAVVEVEAEAVEEAVAEPVATPEAPAPTLVEAEAPAPAAPQPIAPAEQSTEPVEPTELTEPTDPPQSEAQPEAQPAPQPVVQPVPQPEPPQPMGQFVPVAGLVPTTPHLAPTPPHPLTLPPQEFAQGPQSADGSAPAPVPSAGQPLVAAESAPVPAPREAEPERDGATVPVQQAEDLETRAADDEEGTAAVTEPREPAGPAAPGYAEAERDAVLKVMRERRDIRNGFRSDPIPHEVLLRVLEAAHTAPSVGHSQPWDFVVIRSAETRGAMHQLAMRQRDAYANSLPKGRAKQFKELKIEAILDTPVNIVVTADPTRGGRHTLGRHTQPQMAPYSSALAVENLWLAARAEGLGVGWVSFFDEREMVRALGLPDHLEVVAYLCVGYVDEFPEEPELMQAGWSKRRPLSWVVHEETYGRRALPGEEPHDLLAETVSNIRPLDAKALGEAWERQKRMTKPAGALGMLEIISAQLSGLSRQCPPPIPEPAAVAIFAGDHGVHAQGVTPWPQEVTAQMVANFLGGGAVCNAFANQVGAEVCVIDVGVAGDLPATPGLLPRKVRAGTADMTTGPALTRDEVKLAIEVGIETARDLVAAGNKALLTGEMGIANTTASAALISIFTGTDPASVTGRGTGINDETLARKTEVVRRAIDLHQPDPADPIGVLAAIGGLEHAAMVGLLLGGASLRTPVILDGVSAGAAALVARAIAPEVLAACIAGHRSAEPGHVAALQKLGLRPLVDLDLRLGEGTGALLALPVVQSAARAMHEVATFDSAGVTEK